MTGFRHAPNMDSSANNADYLNQLRKGKYHEKRK